MADAAISFAVEKLGDALINKVSFLIGVEDQVRWVKDELQTMRCFLKDAAKKQGNKEYGDLVRKWISDVREVAQDAEDVIEIFTLKVDAPTRKRDLVRKWAGFPSHVSHLNGVGKKIESIRTRLDEIAKRRERYGIGNLGEVGVESSSGSKSEMVERRRRMAAHLQKDKDVVGLNEDADLLFKKVILDSKKGLSLAAIVGMGGIGKSTLARKIYNHPDVVVAFEKCAWVVVSSEFAVEDIMRQIMHELSVPLNADELKTLESIQEKLRRQEMLQQILRNWLVGKRYFIVLDDVWENTDWEVLKNAFPDEQGQACRLLFTSRNEIFTKHHGYIHKMRVLNPDESWELLLKTAFIGRSEGIRFPKELEDIGRKILEKCHGLPLAITVAGGLLVSQGESKTGWNRVLKQMYHLESSEVGSNVLAILELSYHNLPTHMKPCFLCIAFFKEDAIIRAKRLVHIWVSQGFVQVQEGGEETVEERAKSYLDELINRNLVQVKHMSIDGGVKYCYVHDLLRELSLKKAKEEIGFESLIREGTSPSYKPRHRVVRGTAESMIQIEAWNQNKHLRSLFLDVEVPIFDDVNYYSAPSYWKGFELLRILDIEGTRFERLPSDIRSLIGIRYLRLRQNRGNELRLPRWLDVLKNLEVLDVADCYSVRFPDVTWRMDSLRHLYINHMSAGFSNSMKKSSWKNLETLKYMWSDQVLFTIQQSDRRIRKLGLLLVSDSNGEAELGRLLVECTALQALHLKYIQNELPILKSLDHLTKLKLEGHLSRCPSADKFPQNITHLTVTGSSISGNDPMQELGKLPNLLFLKLHFMPYDTLLTMKVYHEGFPRLKVLHLKRMWWLKNIEIEEGGMPQLQLMQFYDCPKVEGIDIMRERIRPAEIIIIAA